MAQRRLADEVTQLVHSGEISASSVSFVFIQYTDEGVRKAHETTDVLFNSDYSKVNAITLASALQGDPRLVFLDTHEMFDHWIGGIAAKHGLVSSTCKHSS
jgi:tyrosyl-tRNA synthetase